jgi:methylenetetrahydrofolate reductase (NADPH)
MARIGELLAQGPTLSYEFSPPKTAKAERDLRKVVQELAATDPSFVSVTYGAGGSTRDRTHEIVLHIHHDTGVVAMPHLTCVGHTRAEVLQLLGQYKDEGIENVLALAGDPPKDGSKPAGDFRFATELIELAREVGGFSVGVAAFPEVHPRSADRESDRRRLAAKLEMADFGITQFGFGAEPYFRMRDELDALGVTTPVLPGVMPYVTGGVRTMAEVNGAAFPEWLAERVESLGEDQAGLTRLGTELAVTLSAELLRGGAPGLHLYTLNRSGPALDVVREVWPGA